MDLNVVFRIHENIHIPYIVATSIQHHGVRTLHAKNKMKKTNKITFKTNKRADNW